MSNKKVRSKRVQNSRSNKTQVDHAIPHKSPSSKNKLVLRVASGLNEGAMFSIKKRKNVIGRKIGASIPLEDAKVSREHAAISFQNGSYFLSDLKSTNGTFLNNRKVDTRLKISVGDQLRVGSSIFKVEMLSNSNRELRQKWGSDTKIIPLRDLNPHSDDVEVNENLPKWASLVPDFKKDKLDAESVRWIGLAIGVILIIGALLTRFNGIG